MTIGRHYARAKWAFQTHPLTRPVFKAHCWTWDHQGLFLWLLGIGTVLGIAADLYMVLVLKITSITMEVRNACDAHNTLYAAGALACFGAAYLTRSSVFAVGWLMLLYGHLFTG